MNEWIIYGKYRIIFLSYLVACKVSCKLMITQIIPLVQKFYFLLPLLASSSEYFSSCETDFLLNKCRIVRISNKQDTTSTCTPSIIIIEAYHTIGTCAWCLLVVFAQRFEIVTRDIKNKHVCTFKILQFKIYFQV